MTWGKHFVLENLSNISSNYMVDPVKGIAKNLLFLTYNIAKQIWSISSLSIQNPVDLKLSKFNLLNGTKSDLSFYSVNCE